MLRKKTLKGIDFYSVDDLNKVLKEPSGTMLAEKAISANSYKSGRNYFRDKDNAYYMKLPALEQIVKPFKKQLNGMVAMRLIKEAYTAQEQVTPEPAEDKTPKKDYSRRLTNVNTYRITHHAATRINERCGIALGKPQEQWLANMAPRLGYMGTQFGGTHQVWGNDEVVIVVSPEDKTVITVMGPDMDITVSTSQTYDDLDHAFKQAVHSIELKENRTYWEEFANKLTELGEFCTAAAKAVNTSRKANSERGQAIMADNDRDITQQYKYLTYELSALIDEHTERLKYIEKKAK